MPALPVEAGVVDIVGVGAIALFVVTGEGKCCGVEVCGNSLATIRNCTCAPGTSRSAGMETEEGSCCKMLGNVSDRATSAAVKSVWTGIDNCSEVGEAVFPVVAATEELAVVVVSVVANGGEATGRTVVETVSWPVVLGACLKPAARGDSPSIERIRALKPTEELSQRMETSLPVLR